MGDLLWAPRFIPISSASGDRRSFKLSFLTCSAALAHTASARRLCSVVPYATARPFERRQPADVVDEVQQPDLGACPDDPDGAHQPAAGRVSNALRGRVQSEPKRDGAARPHYKARIQLTSKELRNVPTSFRLIPGMTVTAEIKAGERSILSYFLYPLLRGLDESIREP